VIVLTTFDDDDYVVRALRDGASGFLLKHTPPGEIVDAVHKVAAGDHMLSPSVNAQIAEELYLSVATVKAHVSRLLTKLEADNRVQIAIRVHDAGLL
jgi:DNA-binding NarL/FixJ family response regulator